jgi:hypothetical protein
MSTAEYELASNKADAESVARVLRVEPQWSTIAPAAQAIGLAPRTLLHAGPPLAGTPPKPILHSACLAAMLEGWAKDLDEAEALIGTGAITLRPAQNHDVVVPLAGVVSPSTQLAVIDDASDSARRFYTPLNEGQTQALRLGRRDTGVLNHLRWLNGVGAKEIGAVLREPIALLPIADRALKDGDDCHGRTVSATAQIADLLAARSAPAIALDFIRASPAFFLNLWMAATGLMMRGADGVAGSSFIRAAAGNGVEFGIQVAGLPGRWFTAPATPPQGPIDAAAAGAAGVGAIGDSAVVDCFGLGGMAMSFAPAVRANLTNHVPANAADRPGLLLAQPHPRLPLSGARVALMARRVVAAGTTPLVTLGIIDRDGRLGRIGGGVYEGPLSVFTAAMAVLDAGQGEKA